MPFYEIIYETGAFSVAFYADDGEAERAVAAHHDRAVNGEEGGPTGHPAERIVRLLKYDDHPANYNITQTASKEEAAKVVDESIKSLAVGGEVSLPELAAAVRDLSSPLVADSAPHDSNFKMKEVAELSKDWVS